MKCNHCDAEIPNESKFCPHCGKKTEHRGSKEQANEIKNFFFNKSFVFITILIIVTIAIIFLFSPNKFNPNSFTIEFNAVPAPYERIVSFLLYLPEPPDDIASINTIIDTFKINNIPLTIFITPSSAFNKTQDDIFNENDTVSFPINDLTRDNTEFASSSYIATNLANLPFAQQELLIKKAKNALKSNDIKPKGFYPPSFSANFDTFLSLENANFDYMIGGISEIKPQHPDSPLGIKMNLIIFPLYPNDDWQEKSGIFLIQINADAFTNYTTEMSTYLAAITNDNTTLFLNISETNNQIRKKEKISATLVTDPRAFITDISFNDLQNSTKLNIITKKNILSINASNISISVSETTTGFSASLQATDDAIRIFWDPAS